MNISCLSILYDFLRQLLNAGTFELEPFDVLDFDAKPL